MVSCFGEQLFCFFEVAVDMIGVVGIGVDDHRDIPGAGEFEDIQRRVGIGAGLEPAGGVEFDGAAIFLHDIQNSFSM